MNVNVNINYFERALENGKPLIKISLSILRVNGDNYVILGYELDSRGERKEISATLSQTKYERLLAITKNRKNSRDIQTTKKEGK